MTIDQGVAIANAVAWILLLGIVCYVLYYFGHDIKNAFPRLTKIGPIELAAQQTSAQPTDVIAATGKSGLQEFISTATALVSKDQLDPVIAYTRAGLAEKKITEPTDLNEALFYYSASLAVTLSHETNYRSIFGSQLQLLVQMEPKVGTEQSAARAIYDDAKSRYPDAYRYVTFEHWLSFLQQANLIATANGNYMLTVFGRGFLKYIRDRQLPLFKLL
jgi:hypothetical protein